MRLLKYELMNVSVDTQIIRLTTDNMQQALTEVKKTIVKALLNKNRELANKHFKKEEIEILAKLLLKFKCNMKNGLVTKWKAL